MMLVYGIALKVNWMNPHWAGFAVAMISLATAGESIHKGMLRLAGTIPGCLSALVILSLAPQSRWLCLLLACVWIFFTTYMMLADKKRGYFWNVAGFVSLIILVTGPSSSESLFMHAMYRTAETGMGVVVYMLITLFLWPRNNLGAIRKTGGMLVATQAAIVQAGREIMTDGRTDAKVNELFGQEIQLLARFAQVLKAEGSESYAIHEMRQQWNRLNGLFAAVMESLDRLKIGLEDLAGIDVTAVLPDLPTFFDKLNLCFDEIQSLLKGNPPEHKSATITLTVDKIALKGVSHLDRAALAVTRQELVKLETLVHAMLDCTRNIAGAPALTADVKQAAPSRPHSQGFMMPVVDPDHLSGAFFAAASLAVGFLIWIYIDPPGHTGWFWMTGTVAMIVAGTHQLKASVLGKSIGQASVVGLLAYVFIMPQLSSFVGLGTLLFIATFVVCYFFTGLFRMAGMIAVINEIAVSNPQVYNFAAMANAFIFTV
ncbi:MAG: FUSC family protein, partial [Deltaproteobacteria bacterium]|nr:FUSC family protein [Deltaproteobacteria bacterium]